jgi:transcription antitermination protein NusB
MTLDEFALSDSPRRRARELVLHGLYASELRENDPQEVMLKVISETQLNGKNLTYARTLYSRTREHLSWADQQITKFAKNWKIERFAEMDLLILRMALVELKEMPDVPMRVVINEAIELAKKYSTAESASFINGILDSYVKETESQG